MSLKNILAVLSLTSSCYAMYSEVSPFEGDSEESATVYVQPKKTVAILVMDGGGMRGVHILGALKAIEEEMKSRGGPESAYDIFDGFFGTSTGGIIAASLTAPDDKGKPAGSVDKLKELFIKDGPTIFPKSVFKGTIFQPVADALGSLKSVVSAKYSRKGLKKVIDKYLPPQKPKLKDALKTTGVTTLNNNNTQILHSYDSVFKYFPIENAVICTTAAPGYFKPAKFKLPIEAKAEALANKSSIALADFNEEHIFEDGGIIANNPIAHVEALVKSDLKEHFEKIHGPDIDYLFVSIGTGEPANIEKRRSQRKSGGMVQLASSLPLDMHQASQADAQNLAQKRLGQEEKYFRINSVVPQEYLTLDETDEKILTKLYDMGYKAFQRHPYKETIIQKLLQKSVNSTPKTPSNKTPKTPVDSLLEMPSQSPDYMI